MTTQPCPRCGGQTKIETATVPVKYHGSGYLIDQSFHKCEQCSMEFTTEEQDTEEITNQPNDKMKKDYLQKKVLLSLHNWIFAPDGKQYRAIYGTLHSINESKNIFGFVPSRNHTNWFAEIGNMIIMGCQIQACIVCEKDPETQITDFIVREHELAVKVVEYDQPSKIYFAD